MIMDDDNIQSDGESESGHEVTTRMRRFRGVLREMMLRHSLKLVQQDLYRLTELSIIMRNESSLLKSAPSMKGREIQDADFEDGAKAFATVCLHRVACKGWV